MTEAPVPFVHFKQLVKTAMLPTCEVAVLDQAVQDCRRAVDSLMTAHVNDHLAKHAPTDSVVSKLASLPHFQNSRRSQFMVDVSHTHLVTVTSDLTADDGLSVKLHSKYLSENMSRDTLLSCAYEVAFVNRASRDNTEKVTCDHIINVELSRYPNLLPHFYLVASASYLAEHAADPSFQYLMRVIDGSRVFVFNQAPAGLPDPFCFLAIHPRILYGREGCDPEISSWISFVSSEADDVLELSIATSAKVYLMFEATAIYNLVPA